MKLRTNVLIWILVLSCGLARAQTPDWENLEVLGRNKEDGHATLIPYAQEAAAREGSAERSRWRHSLNGSWKFHWAPNPESRPAVQRLGGHALRVVGPWRGIVVHGFDVDADERSFARIGHERPPLGSQAPGKGLRHAVDLDADAGQVDRQRDAPRGCGGRAHSPERPIASQ